mgnify:CR=1 FL=1
MAVTRIATSSLKTLNKSDSSLQEMLTMFHLHMSPSRQLQLAVAALAQ